MGRPSQVVAVVLALSCICAVQTRASASGASGAALTSSASSGTGSRHLSSSSRSTCERITIPMCMDTGYNMTRMPNYMGHTSQADAAIQVHEFLPLVQIGCSRHLKFFLCSLYAPMCADQVSGCAGGNVSN